MQATNSNSSGNNPLRFSLRTLLVLMTLAAIASGALFSQRSSDRDEAIFVLCWPVGLLVGIRVGRWRRRSGILEGALGGSISCVVASVLATTYSRPPWLDLSEYLALSVPTGFVFAGALAAIFWYLLDAPPLSGRSLRWFRICGGVGLLFGAAGLIAWGYVQATVWAPRIEIPNPQARYVNPDYRSLCAISPQGQYLAVQWLTYHHAPKDIELFQVGRRRLQQIKLAALPEDAQSIQFAPDETWLAFLESQRLQIVPLPGEQARSQSLAVRYPGYHDTGEELTISRDGQQVFACWHSDLVQRLEIFSSDKLRDHRNQHFTFQGQLSVSPSGKWLVKVHQPRNKTGYFDFKQPMSAEIVRAADLRMVREHVIQAKLDVPENRPGHYYQSLQDVINEMFPDSQIRLVSEADSLAVRGYAKDAEEAAQIVALVESQLNPTTKLLPGDLPNPRLTVIGMLNDLSIIERPLFDPAETCMALDRRVLSLAAPTPGQPMVTTLPGKVVGLLPKGKALVIVESESIFQTRIPFLRHWFPIGTYSQLCIVEISTGQIQRRSTSFDWCAQFHLAQNCLTAAATDGHNTLQIWDIPQVD